MNNLDAQPPDDLADLQGGYAHGDRAAFDALWRLYQESFRRQAFRQTGGDEWLVEEVLGEAALRLWLRDVRESYQPHRPWKPWAAAILRNLIIDQQRRIARLPALELDVERLRDSGGSVGEEMDLAAELADCLAKLPAELRALLESRYGEGLAQVEIAAQLGRSNAWVSRALEKARGLLRDCMSGKGYGGDR